AQQEAAVSKAINEFLTKDLLWQASPGRGNDANITVRELIDRAAAKVGDRFTNHPLEEAAIRLVLGETDKWLGRMVLAETHLQRCLEIRQKELGPNHRDTLDAMLELGFVYARLGKPDEAERLVRHVAETARQTLGPEDAFTLESLEN